MTVTYEALTGRNAGFLDDEEQETLRDGRVFVCGVGGMGGAAVHALARAGVGHLSITDPDHFEASNLNRQAFAYVDTLGTPKADTVRAALLRINPELRVDIVGDDWVSRLDRILPEHPVVVNGMDDLRAGIALYRKAREHGTTVVDAYTSPYPSVTVVRPDDPRPEERLGFPTVGVPVGKLTEEQLRSAQLVEIAWVARVSSGIGRLEPRVVEEIISGRRPRSSFAPVVTVAGSLMAFEAIGCLLGRPSAAGHVGYFFDLWSGAVERPPASSPRRNTSAQRVAGGAR